MRSFSGITLGDGTTKIIAPITPRNLHELEEQALAVGHLSVDDRKGRALAFESGGLEGAVPTFETDILEWRVDFFDDGDVSSLLHAAAILRSRTPLPILATFRTKPEGGERDVDAAEYIRVLRALSASGSVSGIDVEMSRGKEVVDEVIRTARATGVAVIASAHFFTSTPARSDLVALLQSMEQAGADIAKVACMPANFGDTLTLLQATWDAAQLMDIPLITMSMGQIGAVSRVVGGLFGSAATFATVGAASAPGQVPVEELKPVMEALARFSGR